MLTQLATSKGARAGEQPKQKSRPVRGPACGREGDISVAWRDLERKGSLELNESWGRVSAEERAQDAGRCVDRADDRAKV
jgi:hypothetical protein